MKINNSFYKRIVLIIILVFQFSCNEPFPELPAETQHGAGTFGCLVNNELVFAKTNASHWGLDVDASYNQDINQLRIRAKCQFGQQFIFLINDPYKKQDILIDTVRYLPPNSKEWIEEVQTGHFHLTRIDDLMSGYEVVSGNFFFDLNENEKAPVHITKGRFDLNLYFY